MRGGLRQGAGRKRIDIDLDRVEELCRLGFSDYQVAAFLGISLRTFQSRRKEDPAFDRAIWRGRMSAILQLRKMQSKLVDEGNCSMVLHLSRCVLKETDRPRRRKRRSVKRRPIIEFIVAPQDEDL